MRPERHSATLDELSGQRADEREQTALQRALVQLDAIAKRVAPDHVEKRLQRHTLGVQQQLIAGVEHPQVAEHLALLREECRVAAASRCQADDVLGDLAVQELLGVLAGQRELAALRAVEQADACGDGGVVGLKTCGRSHALKGGIAVTRAA